jgi:uncharacterized protein YigA (DUF484 family)
VSTEARPSNDQPADPGLHWPEVRAFLIAHPELLTGDRELLEMLHLIAAEPNKVVDFGRAALARLEEKAKRETGARRAVEQLARANFTAQAQTHAVVVDLLESRNHADLARRLDDGARTRFGLVGAVIAMDGPDAVPFGWRKLDDGGVDYLLGEDGLSGLGPDMVSEALFGDRAGKIGSAAVVRMALWAPARHAVVAFGSPDPEGFSPEMGAELVAFLARVVERTAERWPVL